MPQVNLFATHLNHHRQVWFCWTDHPIVAAQNALIQPWMGLFFYAFLPILLLKRTLNKIMEDQAEEVVLIELAEEIMVHLLLQMACKTPPPPAPPHDGSPVTTPDHEGHALPNRFEDPQVDCVETDQLAREDRRLSEVVIKKSPF